jgi:nucleoside-diphosphate-sugar epimerase
MKVLFIGGTGNISIASSRLAIEQGIELYLLNRGLQLEGVPPAAKILKADIKKPDEVRQALGNLKFDAVVNWINFNPADIARDVELFQGITDQYIFISSASAYQKPVLNYIIREDTPLVNPFWQYSRDKIAAEETLMQAVRDKAFPGVIARPSLTYGDKLIPLVVNSWRKSYTVVARMKRGEKVIVPGDGTSLWSITHNTDFAKGLVGLLGQEQTIGQSFHITTDEVLTWDQLYQTVAKAVGVEAKIVHIPSDFLAACRPVDGGGLHGDKAVSAVFDNSKLKRFVPSFQPTMSFAEGIRRSLAWYHEDKSRQIIDTEMEGDWDKIIRGYELGLKTAQESLSK